MRKTSKLVRLVGGALIAGGVLLNSADAGVVSISSFDRTGTYGGSTIFLTNRDGRAEGEDIYDRAFSDVDSLEIYSNEPGFKDDINAKPINTFGWLL